MYGTSPIARDMWKTFWASVHFLPKVRDSDQEGTLFSSTYLIHSLILFSFLDISVLLPSVFISARVNSSLNYIKTFLSQKLQKNVKKNKIVRNWKMFWNVSSHMKSNTMDGIFFRKTENWLWMGWIFQSGDKVQRG